MERARRAEDPERDALQALGLARRAGAAAIGTRAVREAARAGRLQAVLLARDAAPGARRRLGTAARAPGIRLAVLGDRAALGAAVGRGPVAVVGVTDPGLAERVTSRLSPIRGRAGEG